MSTPLRCGVIGLGVGEQHALAYQSDFRCSLVGLCDSDAAKRMEVGGRFPSVRMFDSWHALRDGGEVDVVSIASFDSDHAPQILEALASGMHVFVEKPLCQTFAELAQIRKALQVSGKSLYSNLVLREAPAFVWLREAIAEGRLGRVFAFDGDYLYGRLHKITSGWRSEIPIYSVIQGGGVHLIDLMQWCLGEIPSEVQAVGNKVCSMDTNFRFPDFAAATFSFPSGIIGRITANFGCVHRHQHVVRVFGTDGTFISDQLGPRFITSRDGQMSMLGHLPCLPPGKGVMIPHFLDAILASSASAETQSHLTAMSLCLAADEALQTGTRIKIQHD